MHFVYIVRCADGTLYTGYARNPDDRAEAHNTGRGARYTAGRGPVRLVYSESHETHGDALRRERQIKRWPRAKKEALIAGRRAPVGERARPVLPKHHPRQRDAKLTPIRIAAGRIGRKT